MLPDLLAVGVEDRPGLGRPAAAGPQRAADIAVRNEADPLAFGLVRGGQAEVPGEVSGVSLINGEPAEIVDAHWLFANHVGASANASDALVCRLPADDPWMQNILRPMVEAAGYRVIAEGGEDCADLIIAAQGSAVGDSAARTIWLRSEPEAAGKKDDSIYRYDRAGLLLALKSAGAGSGR